MIVRGGRVGGGQEASDGFPFVGPCSGLRTSDFLAFGARGPGSECDDQRINLKGKWAEQEITGNRETAG